MNPLTIPRCRCAYCGAIIEHAEARAARAILARFEEESFWEIIDVLGPVVHVTEATDIGCAQPTTCLDCVTQAMFSLVVAPGGHVMLG